MATAYVSFGSGGALGANGSIPVRNGNPTTTETVTTSGTSAASTNASPVSGFVEINCTTALYATVGTAPTAAATTGWYIPAGIPTQIGTLEGQKVALIDV